MNIIMKKNKISKILSTTYTAVGALALLATPTAFSAEEVKEVERIAVTGSRIKHNSSQMTTPTTIIDAEAIAQSGVKNIGDLLNKMPALLSGVGGGSINNNNNGDINNAGLELANLRGLGTNRTLVLVDGRRHVAGSAGSSAVDMSMIPASMVARVEIITGGASAIYGADAVTGVVNFIMRKDIEGFEIEASTGQTKESDGDKKDLSLTWGANFAQGRGNISAHASYSDEKEIPITSRNYANLNHTFGSNPLNTGKSDGISDSIFMVDQRFQALSAEGLFYVPNENYFFGGLPITQVSTVIGPPVFADDPFGLGYDTYTIDREDGHFRNFQAGTNCSVVPCEGGDGFRTEETGTLNAPSERTLFNLSSYYDINNDHRIYAEAKYGKTESAASGQASVFHDDNFGPLITINIDNPFAPQELVSIMQERGLDSVGLAVIGMNARSQTKRETTQFTFGGEGSIGEYGYTFYAQYGKVESNLYNDDVLNENYYRALDAVDDGSGNAVCRSADTHPDCVAYNPIYFQASAEARDYAGVTLHRKDKIEQKVLSFTLDGSLFETNAGMVDFVVGLEYRDESSTSTPDVLSQAIDPDGVGSGLIGSTTGPSRAENSYLKTTNGGYDVSEIFGEVLIPLVEGVTGVESLDLELAARYADHSITGGDSTYKTALNWTIFEEFRLRTTFSHAVRAPNINELFAPEQIRGSSMTDPCHGENQIKGPSDGNRQANCAAIGIGPDFESAAAFGTRSEASRGNIDLNPETADTYTLGLVLTPIENLTIAIDYWNVKIDDAITTFDTTDVLNNCVDGKSLNNAFCDLVNRDELGQIRTVTTQSINAAAFTANGTDIDVNYSVDLADLGNLNFMFKGTYLGERKFQQNAEDPKDVSSLAGQVGTPRIRGLISSVYRYEDLTASWTMNYIGSSTFNKKAEKETYPEWFDNEVGTYVYHNINVNYQINDDLSVYLGADNITDKKPPALPNLNAGSLLYDGIGAKYYAGIKYKF